ncbi:cysteine proteinase [Panaeolus papilionaceus]|nr:cysteine proteinase [Panaeolus papilionaceus]
MSLKRKRQERNAGLAPGEKLKLQTAPQVSSNAPWGWVATEVSEVDEITLQHRLSTCNLSSRNKKPRCRNIYSSATIKIAPRTAASSKAAHGEPEDDVIVISDAEDETCSKTLCKLNPFCLNYLGQDKWEDEAKAEKRFIEIANLGRDPSNDSRKTDLPVGLKNLGATCYANASLQVWFRDLTFRGAVYACAPPEGVSEEKFKESPVFHLQTTFAFLQLGNQSVFNPNKLVESLQLRTTEQQDAQEFSKLFMSHLDTEFKKQSSPELQFLIPNQARICDGTICHRCKNKTESSSDFLEMEISFNKNCTLEDCIEASLAQEVLSGDNRYFCSQCSTLQDATRYTELQKLPPVLHFSLLRFVYDVSSMERKKSKHCISFPMVLDMGPFVGTKKSGSEATSASESLHVYELRGILLHKGASAYHGHYEAQVKDPMSDVWFQCNDDVITRAKGFHNHSAAKGDDKTTAKSQMRKHRDNAGKRRRVDDSDQEESAEASRTMGGLSVVEKDFSIRSRDAYMLIYSRRNPPRRSRTEASSLPKNHQPPERVMKVVEHGNAAHDVVRVNYALRKERHISLFKEFRKELRNIYLNWESASLEDSLVISRQALEAYLGEDAIMSVLRHLATEEDQGQGCQKVLHLDDIVCEHGMLDPLKARDMKVVKYDAIALLKKATGCIIEPHMRPSDICAQCVTLFFREKSYEMRHPLHVKTFDDACGVSEDEAGVWISKKWCREWRLPRPPIHDPMAGDLPPDAPEFLGHVQCEHGGLTLNIANRRRISQEAASFLSSLFPNWNPMPGDSELCASCEADLYNMKEDKRGLRKQIEEEKARLKFLQEPTLDLWTEQLTACAVLPLHFVRQWKRWIDGHVGNGRPDAPDNSPLFCEHSKLTFDPNCPSDTDSLITVISRSDWDVLQKTYPCGALIALTKARNENGQILYTPDVPTCTDCRLKWKQNWVETEIVVRLHNRNHKEETSSLTPKTKSRAIPSSSRNNGTRHSRRLRQIRENIEHRRIFVKKPTTVKEIKIVLSSEFSIPTICQRLCYQGTELEDNEATVASLNILANDILDLREAEEVLEIDTDSDETPAPKRRREKGQGFGGTLLGSGVLEPTCSGATDNRIECDDEPKIEKACPVCTFANVASAVACEMCNSAME